MTQVIEELIDSLPEVIIKLTEQEEVSIKELKVALKGRVETQFFGQ